MRFGVLLIFLTAIPSSDGQVASYKSQPAPQLPHVTCIVGFGRMKAGAPIDAFDTWEPGRRKVEKVVQNEIVLGRYGAMVTYRPGVIHLNRNLRSFGLKRGDNILLYSIRGR